MKINVDVDVHHLSRIEGHGNIKVRVENGLIKEARWDVVETPRFFEVMLQGQDHHSASLLASRICGICSISHSLCSLQATESAFGVEVPEAARQLRLLAKHGETLQSHILHVLFLAAPDFLNEPSVLPLIWKNPEVVALAARLKHFANRLCDAVAGRTTHPVSFQVGGVTAVPAKKILAGFRSELEREVMPDLKAVAELMNTLPLPEFVRETEFLSVQGEAEYPAAGDWLMSSDGVEIAKEDYPFVIKEYVDPQNTSKWTRVSRESYAVGALARLNNNWHLLCPEAADVARTLGLEPVSHNPFMNLLAQVVECVHAAREMVRLLDELATRDLSATMAHVRPRAGTGVGAVEAPRGLLLHRYVYDDRGRILKADCVVPTTQNNANIHLDLVSLVKNFMREGMTDQELERLCSMLVRAYDPCLSCSVH